MWPNSARGDRNPLPQTQHTFSRLRANTVSWPRRSGLWFLAGLEAAKARWLLTWPPRTLPLAKLFPQSLHGYLLCRPSSVISTQRSSPKLKQPNGGGRKQEKEPLSSKGSESFSKKSERQRGDQSLKQGKRRNRRKGGVKAEQPEKIQERKGRFLAQETNREGDSLHCFFLGFEGSHTELQRNWNRKSPRRRTLRPTTEMGSCSFSVAGLAWGSAEE